MSDASAPARSALRFERYGNAIIPAVRDFNARLDAGGVFEGFRLGTAATDGRDPSPDAAYPIEREILLAMEADVVRGGIMLLHQAFDVAGTPRRITNIQLPLSEGVIDKRYAHVALWMIRTVLRSHPHAFAVGMGGADQPLPKLLRALGWGVRAVPFYFQVHRAARFLRGMPLLRRSALRRVAGTAAALSGMGWLALRALERRAAWRVRGAERVEAEAHEVSAWDSWADDVWVDARSAYSMVAVRDRRALEALYPASGDRYHCYRVTARNAVVGWVVLLRKQMRGSPAFGDLTVGTLLDCLARPGFEAAVASAARRRLVDLDVDLAVANQNHESWRRALDASGFLGGPSNYLLATSKALSQAVMEAGDTNLSLVHLTRGDGDGRLQL